jgi:hypothetical protein
MAAMPSPRPVRPSPAVVVPDTATGPPGADPGGVADHLDGRVRDGPALGGDEPAHLGEQRHAARSRPLRTAGAEHRAHVTEPRGRQQRVAQGVGGDVAVGVARAPVDPRPEQPGDPARATALDRMDV